MLYSREFPKWSVMIPTYNCAKLLEQTLLSILQQDPGEELMQIEVVDDFSTIDNPEEVVNRLGKGRIKFFRQSKNVGAIRNFNTCIKRSNGEFVHILHGDDWIENGFYNEINNLIDKFPDLSLYATRSFFVNESGVINSVSSEIVNLRLPSFDNRDFFYSNPLQFAGIVVKRNFYLNNFFDETLIHTADQDMWSRVIHNAGGVVSHNVLSYYRVFDGNDTATLKKTAKNLEDLKRLGAKFKKSYSNFSIKEFNKVLIQKSKYQTTFFFNLKDVDAFKNNIIFFYKNAALPQVMFYSIKLFVLLINKLLNK